VIAVETFGSWGQRGLKFIKEIGKKIQEKTGNKNATTLTCLINEQAGIFFLFIT
jgi:hypothetical protein